MKNILIKLIAVLLAGIFLFYLFYSPSLKFNVLENPNKDSKPAEDIVSSHKDVVNPKLEKGLGTYIGRSIDEFREQYGYPKRIYPSDFSYENYVYQFKEQYYIVGVRDKKIVMLYATGRKAAIEPFKIEDSADKIFSGNAINTEPIVTTAKGKYRFELTEVDIKTQILLKYGKTYMQVFVDRIKNKVMAVKYLDGPTLVEIQPYDMTYNGETIERKYKATDHTLDEVSTNSNNVLTMFELTNIMRDINNRKPLKTDEIINHVAQYQVTKLDSENDKVVTHVEDDIGDDLKDEHITYNNLAQNIAYNFEDVPSLINSWLNADEQREHLLNNKFNAMGGGIAGRYTSLILIETDDEE